MVIKLELNRSYGQQNEDIAKKNKYNNVQIPVITVTDETEVSDNSDILIPISIESTNNTDTGNIWSAEGINKNTTSTASIGKEYVPTYIGQVEYKTYTITVTENDDMYLYLSNLKNIPEYSYNFSGTIYKETGKRNSGMAFSNDSYVDYKNELNSIELKKNITYTPDEFTENQYNITNNIYQYQDDNSETISVNAVDELNNIIQNASETVADGYISNILNYTKPTITKWTNNSVDKTITIEVQCPYSIKFLSSPNGIKRVMYTSYQYSLYEYEYYEYTFSSASIEVFNNLNISQETQTFFSGDRMYSASDSYLFTNGNYLFPASSNISYAKTFANEIYESYKNGKLTLDISYPINQIYDTLDSNVVYIEGHGICKEEDGSFFDIDGNIIDMTNNPKISYNVSLEEGLTCIITKNGESVYKNSDGTDKYFVIQNVNLVYAGILVNEITLIEDSTEPDEFSMKYIQPSHSEITVYASGVTGALPSGSSVDKGATLSIYADFDYGYGLEDDLMNINGQNVEKFANGYWVWTVTGDVIIKPNVIYLGGKYVTYTKDDNCTLHVVTVPLGESQATEIESGTEIFTNQVIDIYGTINDGYKGILTINGEEQELTPSGQYDFYIYYQVENSNLNIELKTIPLARSVTINFDNDAFNSPPFYRIYSSPNNPDSVYSTIYNGGTLYLDDIVRRGDGDVKSGYSITNITQSGFESVNENDLKVVSDIIANYETILAPTKSTLYVFSDGISFDSSKYMSYIMTVTRISSKAGGELGTIASYSGTMTVMEDGVYVTKRYTGYDVLVGDTISIDIKMKDSYTEEIVSVDTTITASPPDPTYGDSVEFANGSSFITNTTRYYISATIE